MAAHFPLESENIIAKLMFGKSSSDIGVPGVYKIGLYTNASGTLNNASVLADIQEVVSGSNLGYASITTTVNDWTVTGSTASTIKTFAASANWSSVVRGYYVATIPTGGGVSRLLFCQDDGPYTFLSSSTYEITLNITVA